MNSKLLVDVGDEDDEDNNNNDDDDDDSNENKNENENANTNANANANANAKAKAKAKANANANAKSPRKQGAPLVADRLVRLTLARNDEKELGQGKANSPARSPGRPRTSAMRRGAAQVCGMWNVKCENAKRKCETKMRNENVKRKCETNMRNVECGYVQMSKCKVNSVRQKNANVKCKRRWKMQMTNAKKMLFVHRTLPSM